MARRSPGHLKLRDYQRAAVRAVDPSLERALCVAACGTGKTLMAVHAAARLLTGGSDAVLVVFPTLGLLEQTYRTWQRESPFRFTAIAVCSNHIRDTEDIHSDELSVDSTTSPEVLARWRSELTGVGVVLCTYQSLGVVAAAHRDLGMAAWTVMVCDEAHRTAGLKGKPFGVALNSAKIPAAHRLFYTATPKVHSGPRTRSGKPRRRTVASMDDTGLYGPQVFTLPTRVAIERGILSPFKVAVIAVSNTAVRSALKDLRTISLAAGEDGSARADHVAAAIALTQAACDYQLSSVLAFHNTIDASAQFAATFRRTHALLTAKGLVRDGRAAGIVHIDGRTKLRDRLAATDTLAVQDPGQWNIVTNARCLTEGINIPALDAVLFAEPRSSEIDVAQAVGRAIRRNPYHDRPALIVLAVTVADDEDAESVINISEFKRARQVLRALQSHDPSLRRDLAVVRERMTDSTREDADIFESDILDVHLPAKLSRRLADQFFRAFSIHTVDTLTRRWEEAFAGAAEFAAEHGHMRVPRGYRTALGIDLHTWIGHQRQLHRNGQLLAERVERLEGLPGWTWNARDSDWMRCLAALQAFSAEHGHTAPGHRYRTADGIALGIWLSNQRTAYRNGSMPAERVALLEAVPGWTWRVLDNAWERNFAAVVAYVDEHGHARPAKDTSVDGLAVGNWVAIQRKLRNEGRLDPERAERLAGLPGWTWNALESVWDENFAALVQYVEEHGDARPAQDFRTGDGFALGHWVTDQRRRRAKLSEDRRSRLESLPGWAWDPAGTRWAENLAKLTDFAAQQGHSYPPRDQSSPELTKLNQWVVTLRRPGRRERLTVEQREQLESLPGWSWEPRRHGRRTARQA
ncbi:Helicase associated domain protein [Mycobacterium avium subsp. hominissuis]|uniref:DEAD/DEAH box helicase n=1 Tax=Mycobacterium avium TaxID=1764 RepID=UPI0026669B40|nr:DEAD/DEAH box helicase [Mycobacterium avium]MDO2396093.1 Helicase associated domain protein [Mycobacterium avium subsp. hominissuis]